MKSRLAGPLIIYVRTDFDEERLKCLLKNVRHINESDEYSVFSCTYHQKELSLLGTGSGPASVLTALYEVLSSDLKTLVRIGACGGLGDARIGDVVVSNASLCMDRVSSVLGAKTRTYADTELVSRITAALNRDNIETVRGNVASVGAMYFFENDIKKAEAQGAYCWDLETATTLSFGKRFGLKTASVLLVVSDKKGRSLSSYPPIQNFDFVKSVMKALTA